MLDKSRDTAKFTTRELLQRLEAVAHPDVFVGSSLLSPETPGGRVLHDDEAGTDDLLDKKLVQGKVGGEELERAVSVGGCFNELVRHSLLSLPVVQYIKISHPRLPFRGKEVVNGPEIAVLSTGDSLAVIERTKEAFPCRVPLAEGGVYAGNEHGVRFVDHGITDTAVEDFVQARGLQGPPVGLPQGK